VTFTPREAFRFHVRIPATLSLSSGEKLDVVVNDFARRGFKCDAAETIPIGSNATLTINDIGSFQAIVRWNKGRSAGGWFSEEVQAELVSHVLTSHMNLVPLDHHHRPLTDLVRC
jgi:hypothetical protein